MNNARRARLESVKSSIEELVAEVIDVMDLEQEALDNLPEKLQKTERGDAMQDAIDNLESAISALEEAQENIEAVL